MHYLYHFVPENLQGDTLYPLNMLKGEYPNAHESQISKYKGREHILEQIIPTLDCLWNDVLHFTAVHPEEVRKALIEAGLANPRVLRVYQVDPKMLDPEKTTVYLYAQTKREDAMKEENFAAYNPEAIAQYAVLPQETKEYYKEMIGKGDRPLLFHRVPHILYKGSLNVSDLPVIVVQ